MDVSSNLGISNPYIVGYMSVDVLREYHHNLSQLKYLSSIPKSKLSYNLNHNVDKAIKRTTDENNEKISLMLKFLLDQKHRLEFLNNADPTFITYRRTLISVMTSTYNREPVSIVASFFKNNIYLCSLEKPQSQKKYTHSDQNYKYCAWGYKFEQYMLSDAPLLIPDIEKSVIENEEFSIYYTSQLKKHKLFYGAQIDGMLATNNATKAPESDDLNSNLSYLRNNHFVELKTNREIHNLRQEQSFKRYKMIRCWCQCYLAGLKGLLVGYRTDDGIIQRVQWFNTHDIVKYCWNEWDPQIAINYLDYFLSYVENSFQSLKDTCDDNFVSTEPLTLMFDIDAFQKITVSKDISQEHVILPDWYVGSIGCNK